MFDYYPEGFGENAQGPFSLSQLQEAQEDGRVLQAEAVKCDEAHDLTVDLGCMMGRMAREEGALGIAEGTTRDIALLSRVGQPVCFVVMGFSYDEEGRRTAVLSRRAAQTQCLDALRRQMRPGDVLPAVVTHLERFGAFCDVGCGVVALLPIDAVSVSRIAHPSDRLRVGQRLRVIIRQIDADGRITLSHKELLGTWEQNAALFKPHQTVVGVVRSVEDYGVFVELTPNLAGLAEPYDGAVPGQRVAVFIKSILPEKMKIKLLVLGALKGEKHREFTYLFAGDHVDRFTYAPPQSNRQNTVFFA